MSNRVGTMKPAMMGWMMGWMVGWMMGWMMGWMVGGWGHVHAQVGVHVGVHVGVVKTWSGWGVVTAGRDAWVAQRQAVVVMRVRKRTV